MFGIFKDQESVTPRGKWHHPGRTDVCSKLQRKDENSDCHKNHCRNWEEFPFTRKNHGVILTKKYSYSPPVWKEVNGTVFLLYTRPLAWRPTLKTIPKYDPLVLNCGSSSQQITTHFVVFLCPFTGYKSDQTWQGRYAWTVAPRNAGHVAPAGEHSKWTWRFPGRSSPGSGSARD